MEVEKFSAPAVARIPAATHHLGVSRSTLYRLIRSGKLRTVQLGPRAVGITFAELARFLAAQQ